MKNSQILEEPTVDLEYSVRKGEEKDRVELTFELNDNVRKEKLKKMKELWLKRATETTCAERKKWDDASSLGALSVLADMALHRIEDEESNQKFMIDMLDIQAQ